MFFLTVLYPISEFAAWYFFIDRYSMLDALMLCVSTSAVGLFIASMQGRALLMDLAKGFNPQTAMMGKSFHRLAMVFGGLFMFLPGLVAKVMGTLLILPGTRHFVLMILKGYFAEQVVFRGFDFFMSNVPGGARDVTPTGASNIVDIVPSAIEHRSAGASTDDVQDPH